MKERTFKSLKELSRAYQSVMGWDPSLPACKSVPWHRQVQASATGERTQNILHIMEGTVYGAWNC